MADQPRDGPSAAGGTPRWVKAFGLVALIVVLLFFVVMLVDRGGHGPGRHAPGGNDGGHTGPPPGITHP
jgi:hypothetical protein